ncbi:MAG: sugar transferase [Candidatus Saccharibacteria bacterium]|nr:sugar transferase [Candidatus Saccharibacteria bacterium]
MKNNFRILFTVFLVLGDIISLIAAFTVAYIIRLKIIDRPPAIFIGAIDFIWLIFLFMPIWLLLLKSLGLYKNRVIQNRTEISKILLASILGICLMISWSYFTDKPFFPAKLVALLSLVAIFVFLTIYRWLIRLSSTVIFKHGYGCQRVLIIGNTTSALDLAEYFEQHPLQGYMLTGFIDDNSILAKKFGVKNYKNINSALKYGNFDLVIDTNAKADESIYNATIKHYIQYAFIPNLTALESAEHRTSLFDTIPVIFVQTTSLYGYGKILKRITDIFASVLGLILSSSLFLIVILLQKITEPYAPIFFKQKRFTLHGKVVYIYKFRSMRQDCCGMPAEDAFEKLGKPELTKIYYDNGQFIDNDPRITKLGAFLRATSLDELPQLVNILKGDISLVGPRALPLNELENRSDKDLILAVKSGLTGLAQVSGRRDISFEERRAIDIYYVQNWSLALDFKIILKTIAHVLTRKGAK